MKNERTSSTAPLLIGMAAGAALGAAGVMATNTSQRQMRRIGRCVRKQHPVFVKPVKLLRVAAVKAVADDRLRRIIVLLVI